MSPVVLVGADTGGTFTDLVAVAGGRLRVVKVRSTPDDPARAVREGLRRLGADAATVLHYGSTVATNALLERKGARVVLLTTAGFEDVLAIGRQTRPALYALEPALPEPLVPAARRLGVDERMLADGRVERPLAASAATRLAADVRRAGAEAIAICLLHAYANPAHEERLRRALAPLGLHVTASHRLLREYREYERTATTVVNAYVGPLMARHLGTLGRSVPGGLRVMQSNGGLIGMATAVAEPVRTVLSGPAGGVVGAATRARRAGIVRILTLDMGGTSTDVSVVDGPLAARTETVAGGVPVRIPTIDIHTVGAGGGSLARIDAGGALRVGPESAGADPGPACYGHGERPTVTDANLVLGRLVETEFLGGAMRLETARARRVLAPLARRLGGTVEQAAAGVVAVVTAAMERALRVITVERGLDPRLFTLVAFGGAGALHAADLARALGMRRVWVPPHPGLLSAWGMVAADLIRDVGQTLRRVEPPDAVLRRGLVTLEREARAALARDGVPAARCTATLEVRYAGQSYEIAVPYGRGWRAAFHRLHERRFGHADASRPLEVVTLRVRAHGGGGRPPADGPRRRGRPEVRLQRRVVFDGRAVRTPVLRRETLPAGWTQRGPAIVCEYSATTVVPPGWRASLDRTGGLLLEAPASPRAGAEAARG
ncbi:MAG: hydantoinase/oxoprolinase family protein [bacterium]|nr:hydantoinase/oxoprolinase family protein [bacterium]